MIIQVRGTSGSGKSTVVRTVMDRLGGKGRWVPVMTSGRKKPLYYTASDSETGRNIVVLGHYESPCGGCDNIGSAAQVYDVLEHTFLSGDRRPTPTDVLMEGLLLSEDVKWSSQIPDLRVLFLVTPLDECLRRIRGRREAAGNTKPLNEANTTNRVGVIERARVKLIDAGVECRRCTSEQAPGIILRWLRLHAEQRG